MNAFKTPAGSEAMAAIQWKISPWVRIRGGWIQLLIFTVIGAVSHFHSLRSTHGEEFLSAAQPASQGRPRSMEAMVPATSLFEKTNAAAYSMDLLDNKQQLAVGDKITLHIIEDRETPTSQIITDAGQVYVPELGLVSALGKTCWQLAREIKGKLEQTAYYQATVIIGIESLNKTLSGRKVFVTGQVRTTGPVEIPAGDTWTVSKIIMRAGGFTDFADKKRVRLIRSRSQIEPNQTFTINVSEIWERGKISQDISVEPEDLIYVPARAINF